MLGGFTTFSTAIVDVQRLLDAGEPGTALAYLAGTLILAIAATAAGLTGGGWLMRQGQWFLTPGPPARDDRRPGGHDPAAAGQGPVRQ